ncbi:MAG: lipase family protein [Endomicrobium sp.]|jgi:hypothetical protein|nr:lipase family protein [Endomicrobium sp.]
MANEYRTLIAPNSWLFGLYASSYEEKGLAYTTEINGEETLVISFRETSNLNEALSDADFFNKSVTIGGLELNVHRGFFNIFKAMEHQIRDLLEHFLAQGTVKRILLTGHRLGGAVALTTTPLVKQLSGGIPTDVITFEAPKPFDKDSAARFKEILGSNSIIIEDKKNIVTKVGYGVLTGGDLG